MLIADLHIHSNIPRTSHDCEPEILDLWARRKGIRLVGAQNLRIPCVLNYWTSCSLLGAACTLQESLRLADGRANTCPFCSDRRKQLHLQRTVKRHGTI
ncbi:hypothetical protein [Ruthenibacterium lactatiformans]|uniref:hypothetical protein n=1 Tax=Ruthenibacterium lactatiformans TaxID=1550024 RepID=UPI0039A16456